jgi:hypothetical protein
VKNFEVLGFCIGDHARWRKQQRQGHKVAHSSQKRT